ncbi:ribonuclease H-like domain-containing protein [Tanacetum coccineum]
MLRRWNIFVEYIDNERSGESDSEWELKEAVNKGKDGVYRVLPPNHHGEQRSWAAIMRRFGGVMQLEKKGGKKMQKRCFKTTFEAIYYLSKGCLEDRVMIGFQNYFTVGCPWCSVSDDDANQKFLRKSKEIIFFTGIGESKQTATPGLADEVIHSFLATNADDVDLIHDDLDQIDDLDLEEMDINWQIAMTAIKIKKFYKEGHGRKPRCGWKMHVAFDKRKVECFNCHNTGHFARECKFKGSKEGGRQEAGKGQNYKPVQIEKEALMTIDEGQINWVEQTEDEELNHALMAFTVNNEMKAENLLFVDDSTVLSLVLASLKSNADVLGYEEEMCSGIFVLRETDEGYYDIHLQQFNRIGSENGKGELGARYSFVRKTCFVYGSLSHLIRIIHERIWRIEVFLIVGCCWAHHDSVTGHLADYKNSPKWDLLLLEEVKEVSVVKICDKKLNVLFTEKECFVVSSDFIDGLHGKSEKQLILLAIPSTGLRWNALALKHLGPVPTTVPTSTNPINTDSSNLNTAFEEVNTGNTEAISPSANHEEERQGTDLTRKKLALQLLYVLDSYKENEEAEQFIWMLLLAQKGDAEEEELVLAKREAMLSRVSKSMLGSELQGKDFAKEMVDLVNQRKKFFAEERAKAKRNKPMTQSQPKNFRQIPDKWDLSAYWRGIPSEEDFLGIAPSYTAIRDPMLRLCHSPGTREADDVVGALEVAKGAPDIDEGAQAVPAPIQAPQPPPATGPARTLSQKVARLSGARYTSYFDFRIPYQRRVRRRTGEASTSAVPLDEDQPDP